MDCSFGIACKGPEEILSVWLESGEGDFCGEVRVCQFGAVPSAKIGQEGALTELKAIGEKRKLAYGCGFPREGDFLAADCYAFKCPDEGGQGIEEGDCEVTF